LKRGSVLHSLIGEMERARFTGYCKIVSEKAPVLLVFSDGKIVLAECGTLIAHAAMEEISHSGDTPVDSSLHELSSAQIQLALEFNHEARVDAGVKPGRIYIARSQPRRDDTTPHPKSPTVGPSTGSHRVTVPERSSDHRTFVPADEETALLIRDLDALDSLDIQAMTENFRASCRQMIKKLELEHLLEKDARDEGS
jgi:hypothetical protein